MADILSRLLRRIRDRKALDALAGRLPRNALSKDVWVMADDAAPVQGALGLATPVLAIRRAAGAVGKVEGGAEGPGGGRPSGVAELQPRNARLRAGDAGAQGGKALECGRLRCLLAAHAASKARSHSEKGGNRSGVGPRPRRPRQARTASTHIRTGGARVQGEGPGQTALVVVLVTVVRRAASVCPRG